MYTGQIDWEQVDKDPLAMIMTADELLLDELLDLVQGHLIEKRAGWLSENNAYVLNVVVDRDTCSKLRDHALGIISADASTLFKSDSFIHLQASIVKGLVQRDDLPIAEFELWQGLVRWAVANTGREVATDPSIWSPEDREAVRLMMQDFIPYVRFYDISGPDFLDGVLPLKMLPKKLKWDLIKFHIDPSRKPNSGVLPTRRASTTCVDSVLIKLEQATLIQNWINDRSNSTKQPKWKLLYRASHDGYGAKAFHSCCDNKGPTVTVVKRQGNFDLIGGYTPLSWKSDGRDHYDDQAQSFVFSLGHNNVLSRIKDITKPAIYSYNDCGPMFGTGCDICIAANCNNNNNSYSKKGNYEYALPNSGHFRVDDYEVFQIQ